MSLTICFLAPSINLKVFYCNAATYFKNGNSVIPYKPIYAEGPDQCTIRTVKSEWDLCKVQSITVDVDCVVSTLNTKPGVMFSFNINNVRVSNVVNTDLVNNSFVSQLAVNITSAGDAMLKCQAQNSKFEDSTVYCEQTIFVRAPPPLGPTIIIKDSTDTLISSVEEHEVYTVSCLATGGVPPVSNVTVSCGNITESTQSGNIFTSSVTFTRNMTGQNCTCTAQHITECYGNNSAPVLNLPNVRYISKVTNFKVQSSVIKNGTWIELVCEAEGNPLPTVAIVKGSTILYQILSGETISLKKTMFCGDAGYYICQTNNGIYGADFQINQSQTLTLYVACPLQLLIPQNNIANYSHSIGDSLSINVDIQGYPEPSNIVLLQIQNNSNDEIKLVQTLSNYFTSITKNITVSYILKEPPYIQLQIDIMNITYSDFTKYTMIVTQNGLQNLTYSFFISCAEVNSPLNKKETNVGAIVGGCIAAVVVVVLIKRKYEIVLCKKKQIKIDKRLQNYSDLLATSEQQDRHNYETLQIIDDAISLHIAQNAKSQYNNFSVPETIDGITTTVTPSSYCDPVVVPEVTQEKRFVVKGIYYENEETADHRYEDIDIV